MVGPIRSQAPSLVGGATLPAMRVRRCSPDDTIDRNAPAMSQPDKHEDLIAILERNIELLQEQLNEEARKKGVPARQIRGPRSDKRALCTGAQDAA